MFSNLSIDVQESAELAYQAFRANPDDPALHRHALKNTKKGRHKDDSWAVWVTRRYRAIYFQDGNDNV